MHVNPEKRSVTRARANQIIRDYAQWPVVDNTLDLLLSAVGGQARWQISRWDVAAARTSGASELISEDFNHSQNYDGVRAINPFR